MNPIRPSLIQTTTGKAGDIRPIQNGLIIENGVFFF
jgi:hypothetical protein